MSRSVLAGCLVLGLSLPAALAQTAGQPTGQPAGQPTGQAAAEEDGPGRGVARISLMNGDVSVRRGDSGDWVAAAINGPLMADDRVLTGPGARAEVQLNYYNRVRLAGDTEARFPELEWHKYQIQVANGTVVFAALPGTNDQIEFATPAASLRPLAAGSYRITVQGGGMVTFTVRRGEAEIYTPHGTRRLAPGRTMKVHLAEDGTPEFQMIAELPRDMFDEFNDGRDQELSQVKSYQYMSRDIEGGEQLDGAGDWVNDPNYGNVWRPYVSPDWAPYQDGRWTWLDYYGWTWVSYDPWGWAPYHYGRWYWNGGWFWYPGGFGAGIWWRPALVGFFGWGGVGFGFGYCGWVPLGPWEHYHPWYGRGYYGGHWGGRYPTPYNANLARTYRNAQAPHAVHSMTTTNFGRGSAGRGTVVSPSSLSNVSAIRGPVPVTPGRESLWMSDRTVTNAAINRGLQTSGQHFVASRQAPSVNRVSFDQQRQNITQSIRSAGAAGGFNRTGATAGSGAGNTLQNGAAGTRSQGGWPQANSTTGTAANRTMTPSVTGTRTVPNSGTGTSTNAARGGWGSFGAPGGTHSTGTQQATTTRSSSGGWTSFGDPGRGTSSSSGYTTNANGNVSTFRGSQGTGEQNRPATSGGWSTGGGRVYGMQEPGGNGGSGSRSSGGWSSGGSTYGSSTPHYGTSGGGYGSSTPHNSTPSGGSSPHYSAPSGGSGGGHASASSGSGGGGHASSSSGGGGGHSGGGGGGHSGHR